MEIKQNAPIHLCTDRALVCFFFFFFRQGFMPEHISNLVKKKLQAPREPFCDWRQ